MIWNIVIVLYAIWGIWFYLKKRKEWKDAEKQAEHWGKIAKAYPKNDYATITKIAKKIKPKNDPVFQLVEAERYMFGEGVFKDPYKAVELLKEVNKLPMPAKLPIQQKVAKIKNPKLKKFREEMIKKRKDVKKQMKKEAYIKKIKKAARENWNTFELWEIDHEIRRGNVGRNGGV